MAGFCSKKACYRSFFSHLRQLKRAWLADAL
jgi:hypothetical protein